MQFWDEGSELQWIGMMRACRKHESNLDERLFLCRPPVFNSMDERAKISLMVYDSIFDDDSSEFFKRSIYAIHFTSFNLQVCCFP